MAYKRFEMSIIRERGAGLRCAPEAKPCMMERVQQEDKQHAKGTANLCYRTDSRYQLSHPVLLRGVRRPVSGRGSGRCSMVSGGQGIRAEHCQTESLGPDSWCSGPDCQRRFRLGDAADASARRRTTRIEQPDCKPSPRQKTNRCITKN